MPPCRRDCLAAARQRRARRRRCPDAARRTGHRRNRGRRGQVRARSRLGHHRGGESFASAQRVGTGATSIHGLRFDLKQRDAIERDALRLAVVDARARAEAVAAGAGAAVGRIVRIEESSARVVPPPQSMMMARMAVDEARQTTPVAAGEIEIRGQVTLTVGVK
ncbi:MAG: SIMPL domain-containing protein [Acidobacteria bacterium]|nr:SIMPL domain-containing protein [Acidobacteriota bacterium]